MAREWWKGVSVLYIKVWFKPIFHHFLTWLLRKWKFVIPIFDSPPAPPVLLAKLRWFVCKTVTYWTLVGCILVTITGQTVTGPAAGSLLRTHTSKLISSRPIAVCFTSVWKRVTYEHETRWIPSRCNIVFPSALPYNEYLRVIARYKRRKSDETDLS